VLGVWGRTLIAIVGLLTAALCVTGFLIWRARQRRLLGGAMPMAIPTTVAMAYLQPIQQGRDDQAGARGEVHDQDHDDSQQLRVGQIEFEEIQE
jgi:hypothetical protein